MVYKNGSWIEKKEYESLKNVLEDAYVQSSSGKGMERHANDDCFEDQPIFWIQKYFPDFQLGQAVKKMHESQRLAPLAAIKELLGAIIYICAKVITLKRAVK